MAEYKEIHGTKIRTYTTNPDNPITGEVWYNDTDNVLKFAFTNTTTAWSTGGTLNTGRESLAGAGIQTAALAFGGEAPPNTGATELYNGSSWTELNDLSTVRYGLAGVGLYTAALAFGGNTGPGAVTESFNGTNWTEVNDLNTARNILTGIGIQTSALAVGGYTTTRVANTEAWNGTNWTEVNDMNTAKMRLGGNIGVDSTAGLAYGGSEPGGVTANTEQWNGSSWTEVNNLNTGRDSPRGGGTITDRS